MPTFSQRSLDNLETCDPRMQEVAHEAIKHFDFVVICGHRGQAEQDSAYAAGRSRLKYPKSKHNRNPSPAFDAIPFPIDWTDIPRFQKLAAVMKKAAETVGVRITWGGDWSSFVDMPHYELAE